MNPPIDIHARTGWSLDAIVQAARGQDDRIQDLAAHLAQRVQELGRLDRRDAQGALSVLAERTRRDDAGPEELEAAVLFGIAHPKLAARLSLGLSALGRRAAQAYTRQERDDRAAAILGLLAAQPGDNRAVERDLAGLLRRSGELDQLIRRYVARAQERIDAGQSEEAIPWLQEILVADPSRKDIARMIRDLRFEQGERLARKRRMRRRVKTAGVLAVLVCALVVREHRLGQAYARLGQPAVQGLAELESHLAALEAFIGEHPLWHGAPRVIEERARLRGQVEALRAREAAQRERDRQAAVRGDDQASFWNQRARSAAELGDWARALEHYQKALSLSSANWSERSWAERNVEALQAMQGEKP